MRYEATDYGIPPSPPDELLAELDAAARTLDELSARALELTLAMDEQTGSLRIGLADTSETRTLTPTELFGMLASPAF